MTHPNNELKSIPSQQAKLPQIVSEAKQPVASLCVHQDRSNEDAGVIIRCKSGTIDDLSDQEISQGLMTMSEMMKLDAAGKEGGSTACVSFAQMTEKPGNKQFVRTFTLNAGDSHATLLLYNEDGTLHSSHLLNKAIHQPSPDHPLTRDEYDRLVALNKMPIKDGAGHWRLRGSLAVSRAYGDADFLAVGLSQTAELNVREFELPPNGRAVLVVSSDVLDPLVLYSDKNPKKPTLVSETVTKKLNHTPDKIAAALVDKARKNYWLEQRKKTHSRIKKIRRLRNLLSNKSEDLIEKRKLNLDLRAARNYLEYIKKLEKDDSAIAVVFVDSQFNGAGIFDGHGQKTHLHGDPNTCGNSISGALAKNLPARLSAAFEPVLAKRQGQFSGTHDLVESSYCSQTVQFKEEKARDRYCDNMFDLSILYEDEDRLEESFHACEAAAMSENPCEDAWLAMGHFYNHALGVERDTLKALMWYRKAEVEAKNGNCRSDAKKEIESILAELREKNDEEARLELAFYEYTQNQDKQAPKQNNKSRGQQYSDFNKLLFFQKNKAARKEFFDLSRGADSKEEYRKQIVKLVMKGPKGKP